MIETQLKPQVKLSNIKYREFVQENEKQALAVISPQLEKRDAGKDQEDLTNKITRALLKMVRRLELPQ
jgi:hypothetical protein